MIGFMCRWQYLGGNVSSFRSACIRCVHVCCTSIRHKFTSSGFDSPNRVGRLFGKLLDLKSSEEENDLMRNLRWLAQHTAIGLCNLMDIEMSTYHDQLVKSAENRQLQGNCGVDSYIYKLKGI